MNLAAACEWLQALPWAAGIKESAWQFPVIESVHSLALSFMLWPVAILDLRLLGVLMKRKPVTTIARQFLPWVWTGFAVMFLTGALLFASEAVKCYNSQFFRVKLLLLILAGCNAFLFHNTVYRKVAAWDESPSAPWRAKLAGACSLTIWVGVVAMGRALAYA